jgi:putative transposase
MLETNSAYKLKMVSQKELTVYIRTLRGQKWDNFSKLGVELRDYAIREFCSAVKSAISNRRGGNITHFKMSFKRKKDRRESFKIKRTFWGTSGIYWFTENIKVNFRGEEVLLDDNMIKHEVVVTFENDRFYVSIQYDRDADAMDVDTQNVRLSVSLDPGVRTFMTGYDPQGYSFEFGRNDHKRLYRLHKVDYKLQGIESTRNNGYKHKSRLHIRKLRVSIRARIRGLVDEVHRKLIDFLTQTYQIIKIPKFGIKGMMRGKKLGNKTKTAMQTWRHFEFRRRLLDAARKRGVKVDVCTEEFTSMNCTRCGFELKTSSRFKKCPKCGLCINRDVAGSRNIDLKRCSELYTELSGPRPANRGFGNKKTV